MIKVVKPDFIFADERGSLVQLAREGFRQINYVFSIKGSFRGGHYHKENTECFYVLEGKFEILLELNEKKEVHVFQAGDMFYVFPMVVHSFTYLEDTRLIGMYDIGVERPDGTKDIYPMKE